MPSLSADYARDLYHRELQALMDFGEPVDVRGRKTMELLNFVSEVREPWHHCILLPSRRWNPWTALSEGLWILAGRSDIKALLPYNKRIAEWSDDGETLYGAYGPRMFDQIDNVIARLRNDPGDRRAVLSIWGEQDLTEDTKDPPCNDMVMFKLRDFKLHMTVCNRSNDIHWGLFAVNLPTFSMLQVYIAARLGVGVGTQVHLSNSLHVYIDQPEPQAITERMLITEPEDRPAYPHHDPIFKPNQITFQRHRDVADMCSAVLDGQRSNRMPPFLQFASYFLRQYREHKWEPDELLFGELYADWVLSGQVFVDKMWKVRANGQASA